MVDRGLLAASEILYRLSGGRWRGTGCTRTLVVEAGPRGELPLPLPGTGQRPASRHPGSRLTLPDYPVTSVTSVHVNTILLPAVSYRLENGRWLRRLDGAGDPIAWTGSEVQVIYAFGAAPPYGGARAAEVLGVEIALALAGSESCALPQRVQTITRQGMTVAMLDPQDYLREGLSGLPEVDLWLAAVNPGKLRRPSTVWSPDVDRTTTRYL